MSYTIGIDIGGTNIKAGLVHNQRVIKKVVLPTIANKGPELCIGQIKRAIELLQTSVSRIGIGIAGIIDSKNGIVRYSPNLKGWFDTQLSDILGEEFGKKVRILNDVNAVLLGEWQYGAGKGYGNIFLFTLGTGIGGAAVCQGKMVFGANGFAGEFGHTIIKYNGPKCVCGKKGCLERFVGSRYIVQRALLKIKSQRSTLRKYKLLTPKIIAQEARSGDIVAQKVFEETGYYIGIGVSNIINLLDPEIVIISGGIARAGRVLFEPIRKTVKQVVIGNKYRQYKIIPAKLGDNAGILGSAYFASPKYCLTG